MAFAGASISRKGDAQCIVYVSILHQNLLVALTKIQLAEDAPAMHPGWHVLDVGCWGGDRPSMLTSFLASCIVAARMPFAGPLPDGALLQTGEFAVSCSQLSWVEATNHPLACDNGLDVMQGHVLHWCICRPPGTLWICSWRQAPMPLWKKRLPWLPITKEIVPLAYPARPTTHPASLFAYPDYHTAHLASPALLSVYPARLGYLSRIVSYPSS